MRLNRRETGGLGRNRTERPSGYEPLALTNELQALENGAPGGT